MVLNDTDTEENNDGTGDPKGAEPSDDSGIQSKLSVLLTEFINAREPLEREFLEDYQDKMMIPRQDDTSGSGIPSAVQGREVFIGSTRGKVRTARGRLKRALFPNGQLPFDAQPTNNAMVDYVNTVEAIMMWQASKNGFRKTTGSALDALCTYGTNFMTGPWTETCTLPSVVRTDTGLQDTSVKVPYPDYRHARVLDTWPDPHFPDVNKGRGVFNMEWVTQREANIIAAKYGVTAPVAESGETSWFQSHGSWLTEQVRRVIQFDNRGNRLPMVYYYGAPDAETPMLYAMLIGDRLIHSEESPWGEYSPVYRCVYEEEEGEVFGTGIPRNNRSQQKIQNAAFRLFLSGKAWALLGIWDVDRAKFSEHENFKLHPGKVLERAYGVTPEEAKNAINHYVYPDVTGGWADAIALSAQFSDDDTGITKYTQGTDSSSLNNTATGINRIMDASNVPLEEVLGNVDEMQIKPIFESQLKWNMDTLTPEHVEAMLGPEHAKRWAEIKQLGNYHFMEWKPTGSSTFARREMMQQKIVAFTQYTNALPNKGEDIDWRAVSAQLWETLEMGESNPFREPLPPDPAQMADQKSKIDERVARTDKAHATALKTLSDINREDEDAEQRRFAENIKSP